LLTEDFRQCKSVGFGIGFDCGQLPREAVAVNLSFARYAEVCERELWLLRHARIMRIVCDMRQQNSVELCKSMIPFNWHC